MNRNSSTREPSQKRCPACGQLWESPASESCSLCGYSVRTPRNTGEDRTPYAIAFSNNKPGWKQMSEWVWFSGYGRLKHLALMKASKASRHYARVNAYFFAVAMAIVQLTRVGWQWVRASAEVETPGWTQSAAGGWLRVVGASGAALGSKVEEGYISLWWNPAQAVIGALTAAIASLVLFWVGYGLMRVGVAASLTSAYRGEDRMTAALHYGSAWLIPSMIGAFLAGLQPIGFFGTMAGWGWSPPQRVFLIGAAVFSGVSMVMGWFWLVRLGATAPSRTRTRVFVFFVLGAPLIVLALVAVWWKGLDAMYPPLFSIMKLNFG